jgi:signal transduction histidine kinase
MTRQQVLELAILPEGDRILSHPLDQIWGYLRCSPLVLPGTLSITAAMQRAVLRSSEGLGDPVVVRTREGDRLLDFPTLSIADWQIRGIETQVRYERMQVRSIQNEKMASLGRLMDGVAHQILDPVGFIWGNLSHVQTYAQQLLELVEVYQQQIRSQPIPPPPPQSPPIQPSSIQSPPIQPPSIQPQDPLQESQLGAGAGRSPDADALAAIADLEAEIDLDFLRQDLPQTLASIRNGADRLRHIVTSLQNFCHLDEVYPKPADLNHHLDSIILLLQSRLAVSIHFERHYATLPPVVCYIGQLTQVFANVLSNAVETLLDQAASQAARPATALTLHPVNLSGDRPPPCIEVRTALIEVDQGPPWVSVQIADNGPGLPPGQAQKLLSAWAEVRRLGKETSLATSYAIVTAKHGGVMELRDRRGGGLEVEIRLPLVENS